VILLPRRGRILQPQQPVQPDWNALRGCTAVWCAAFPQIMQLREGQIARKGSIGAIPGASAGGAHLRYSNVAHAGEDFGSTRAFRSNSAFGALYVGAPVAASTFSTPISQRQASSVPMLGVLVNRTAGLSILSGCITLHVRSSAAANNGVTAADQCDGKLHTWYMRVSSVAAENGIWRDGVRQTLHTSLPCTGTNVVSAHTLRVGNQAATDFTGNAAVDPLYLVATWSELVTDDVAAELSRSPWKVFPAPSRRLVWSTNSAAASVTPALVSSTASVRAHSVARQSVASVAAGRIESSALVASPAVSSGTTAQVNAPRIESAQSVGSHTVTRQAVAAVSATHIPAASLVRGPTVGRSSVAAVGPGRIDSAALLGVPTVSSSNTTQIVVGRIASTVSFGATSVVRTGSGTADPAEVWAYVLSNGLTAEQTLVQVHAMLLAGPTTAEIAAAVWAHAQ